MSMDLFENRVVFHNYSETCVGITNCREENTENTRKYLNPRDNK